MESDRLMIIKDTCCLVKQEKSAMRKKPRFLFLSKPNDKFPFQKNEIGSFRSNEIKTKELFFENTLSRTEYFKVH